ncbi:hypothetical protein N9J02_00830 [bacterium]|jgi:hypothetical protein|nr:hypothetical protein [bacterium]
MAKRRFRIEGGRYGGELVLGEANPEFIKHYQDLDEGELIDVLLEEDSQGWTSDDEPEDALLNPETPPSPVADPGYGYNMWECDDVEHLNSAYADGGFYVYEIPADGTDDWDYEKVVYEGDGMLLYSREGGYFNREEPTENTEEYMPVICFHSSEKGTFGAWFVETDGEDFDEFKLGYTMVETNLAELIETVYYDKEELETDYDYNDSTGKSYGADMGWLNKKWHDSSDKYTEEDMKMYWEEFDDNVEWEKENR